jgi:hypothetical protein
MKWIRFIDMAEGFVVGFATALIVVYLFLK